MKKTGIAVILLWLCMAVTASAEETDTKKQEQIQDTIFDQFDFSEMNQVLKDIFPGEKLNFADTVKALIDGDTESPVKLIGRLLKDQLTYEFRYNKETLIHMILIAIIAAVFTNFSGVFKNRQVSEIGFYVLYLLMITLCLNSFRVTIAGISDKITVLTDFMKILGPLYFLAVAFASGSVTSVVFYNLVLFLIYLVEIIILNFLLPLIHVYIMMKILNNLSSEDYLSKFTDLIETICTWTLKTFLACVIGLNVIQGLISPVVDSLKRSVVTKGVEAIPGVGDALGGVTEVVLGTAVLIKNGIGMTGAVISIAICAVPLIQIAVMALMYKLASALIQPISDKRMVECISSVGDGCQLLIRVVFTTGMLFLLTIAVVAATTGKP